MINTTYQKVRSNLMSMTPRFSTIQYINKCSFILIEISWYGKKRRSSKNKKLWMIITEQWERSIKTSWLKFTIKLCKDRRQIT